MYKCVLCNHLQRIAICGRLGSPAELTRHYITRALKINSNSLIVRHIKNVKMEVIELNGFLIQCYDQVFVRRSIF